MCVFSGNQFTSYKDVNGNELENPYILLFDDMTLYMDREEALRQCSLLRDVEEQSFFEHVSDLFCN